MNILNNVNNINDKKVNNTAELNLLHDILNPYKLNININCLYSPILHRCMNTHRGKSKF